MRAKSETYEKVAQHCSEYTQKLQDDSFSNCENCDKCSCTTCQHFTDDAYCDIDLYDQIVYNHNFE